MNPQEPFTGLPADENGEQGDAMMTRRGFNRNAAIIGAGAALTVAGVEGVLHFSGDGDENDHVDNEHREIQPYTLAQVQEHVGHSRKEWMSAGEALRTLRTDCVDGRGKQCAVCTPGGDMGDFILFLTATEKTSGRQFGEQELRGMLERYLTHRRGTFYMHTDRHGIKHLAERLHVTEREVKELLEHPGDRREELLHALFDPANVGCGHLQQMIGQPQNYPDVRLSLVRSLIRSFFNLKWDGNPRLDYVVLEGEHGEGAVIKVCADHETNPDSIVLLIQPKVGEGREATSVFVVHPQIEELSEQRWLRIMSDVTSIEGIDPRQCQATMRRLRERYFKASARALASGKPLFSVVYKEDHTYSVEPA